MLVGGASAGFFFLRATSTGLFLTKATKRMQTSPFFASQAPRTHFPVPSLVGGPSLASAAQAARAVLPRGAEAQHAVAARGSEVLKLDTSLYHRTVFTMPLPGKLKHAKITIYFDKQTLDPAYVSNVHALAVLCDEDPVTIQSGLGAFIKNNLHFKEVRKDAYDTYRNEKFNFDFF